MKGGRGEVSVLLVCSVHVRAFVAADCRVCYCCPLLPALPSKAVIESRHRKPSSNAATVAVKSRQKHVRRTQQCSLQAQRRCAREDDFFL